MTPHREATKAVPQQPVPQQPVPQQPEAQQPEARNLCRRPVSQALVSAPLLNQRAATTAPATNLTTTLTITLTRVPAAGAAEDLSRLIRLMVGAGGRFGRPHGQMAWMRKIRQSRFR